MTYRRITFNCLTLFTAWLVTQCCQAQIKNISLDSIVVTSQSANSPTKGNVTDILRWNANSLKGMPHFLGAADPLHYTQTLPSVQTNNEGDAGLHIQGSDNAHNDIMLDGVTLYNPTHLLGLFSVFNASHFQEMTICSNASSAYCSNKLGGALNMLGDGNNTSISPTSGEFSLGLLSSQGTFSMPLNKRMSLRISGRASYINLLYRHWMKIDDNTMYYRFTDTNLTWKYLASQRDNIWIEAYFGGDNANFGGDSQESITLNWQNLLIGAHWLHRFDNATLKTTLYHTHYDNILNSVNDNKSFKLLSAINDLGYKESFVSEHWNINASFIHHSITPQYVDKNMRQLSNELTGGIHYNTSTKSHLLHFDFGIKGGLYWVRDNKLFSNIDPSVSLKYALTTDGIFGLQYSLQHQYLHQTGFSAVGLPTEFWMSSTNKHLPEFSNSFSLSYNHNLLNNNLKISIELYYKYLFHQLEYIGNMFDFFLDKEYVLDDMLREGTGRNYGMNIMINKQKGSVTGWISYAYSRALRRFESKGRLFPSSHDRPHEFNCIATWNINRNWSIGGTLVVASGTPFTAPKYFYTINNRVLSEYAEYNANRLPAYKRLDFCANYKFSNKTRHLNHSINFSIYNALGFSNSLYYRLRLAATKGEYGYKSLKLITFPLPSISYYVSF